MNTKQYRLKALKLITKAIENDNDDEKTYDYALDDLARLILNLPSRPIQNYPYVGWISQPSKKEIKPLSISQKGISLIKRWEGFRNEAYLCPAGVWTIGYGNTNSAFKGKCISKYEGEQLLKDDLRRFESAVRENVKVNLTQGQYDALVSFSFNVGITAFVKSTLLRELNRKNYIGAANQFTRWVYAKGKKLPGLISRRQEEKKLFLS